MLKRGYLASNLTYISLAHNKSVIDNYTEHCYLVFKDIKEAIDSGTLTEKLNGEVCHSGFNRLT